MWIDDLRTKMLDQYAPHLVCGPQTDLVIEGFPRSSNSFTVWMINILRGEAPPLSIAHHTHSADNLRLAAHFDIPMIALVRPPEDAILSYIIYAGRDVDFATKRYTRFFNDILKLRRRPMVVEFQTVVTDFNQVITRLNTALIPRGLAPVTLSQDLDADTATVHQMARARAQAVHGAKSVQQVGVPSQEREAIKATRRAEVQDYLAAHPEVAELYAQVVTHGA